MKRFSPSPVRFSPRPHRAARAPSLGCGTFEREAVSARKLATFLPGLLRDVQVMDRLSCRARAAEIGAAVPLP